MYFIYHLLNSDLSGRRRVKGNSWGAGTNMSGLTVSLNLWSKWIFWKHFQLPVNNVQIRAFMCFSCAFHVLFMCFSCVLWMKSSFSILPAAPFGSAERLTEDSHGAVARTVLYRSIQIYTLCISVHLFTTSRSLHLFASFWLVETWQVDSCQIVWEAFAVHLYIANIPSKDWHFGFQKVVLEYLLGIHLIGWSLELDTLDCTMLECSSGESGRTFHWTSIRCFRRKLAQHSGLLRADTGGQDSWMCGEVGMVKCPGKNKQYWDAFSDLL